MAWESRWSAFGEVSVLGGNVAENALRFPGQYADPESGLYQNYFRDYASGLGRYVEADPIGLREGVNEFVYAFSNVVGYFDSIGLSARSRSDWDYYRSDKKGKGYTQSKMSQGYRDAQTSKYGAGKPVGYLGDIGSALLGAMNSLCLSKWERVVNQLLNDIQRAADSTQACGDVFFQINYHMGDSGCPSDFTLQISNGPDAWSDIIGAQNSPQPYDILGQSMLSQQQLPGWKYKRGRL